MRVDVRTTKGRRSSRRGADRAAGSARLGAAQGRSRPRPDAEPPHHFGEVAGGPLVGRIIRRVYALPEGRGAAFHEFPGLASPSRSRAEYRRALDECAWTAEDERLLVAEALTAYDFVLRLLHELGGAAG
jgi:hypothetical protein